jgi:hypothetical protein
MTGAVAVAGIAGQVRALGGFPGVPDGTGVESINRRIGTPGGVTSASFLITRLISGPAARSRLP